MRIKGVQLSMDAYSGKRAMGRVIAPRKGSNVNLKGRANDRDQNAQFCNRIGCSGRIKYSQNTKIGILDKAKCAKPSSRLENRKEIIRNTSRTCSVMTSAKKSYFNPKSSHVEFDSSESSISSNSEGLELLASPSRVPTGYQSELTDADSGKVTKSEIGSSSVSSNVRSRKVFHRKSGSCNQNTPPASSVPSVPNSSGLGTSNSGNGSRCGLRNLKYNSISDVVPRSCSSLESKSSRKGVMKKRNSEGESSSSCGGKKTNGAVSFNGRVSRPTNGIFISDSRRGSWTPQEDASGAASVRRQRSTNVNTRMRLSNRHNGNVSSLEEPAVIISRFSQPETPVNVDDHGSSQQFSAPVSSSGRSSYSLSSNNGDFLSSLIPSTSMGFGTTRLVNHDALQRHSMDGVAEILLALERIGQDEQLTNEQILAFEASLFISGLNLYDQHRAMRLDIDSMSYEELLALEECMGTVSTAVSEEELSKCLRRSIYNASLSDEKVMGSSEDGDDIKCSICQEEYVLGDEIGKLVECQHGYHLLCIHKWLRLKNWCPICKTSAVPS
ncbi:RING/U-box superfamily protein [Forsythia ovata]|uniref:RING-type E3 ubiquitin transferase n=1 Tax=Forsythia ovata TaxID=205694 RepID=A0ABD1RNX8_9LAMI